jgi:ShK domain-like
MTPSRSIAQLLGFLVVCSCAISSADESESGLPTAVASVEIEMPIEDLNESCAEWAQIGECDKNPAFMLENCAVSCDSPRQRTAFIADGEDFAVGAIRFSEDFGVQDIPFLLQVAKKLLDASSDYTPPGELTHCIAPGKPTKPCTAGKLWKRAEDLRKAEIHDEAAADLVRALLKSGIEIDFVENAQRSLSWALQSIQRQRERERKEAEEEAKMEARKQEEMLAMEEAAYRKKEYEHAFGDFFKRVATSASNESNSAASADMEADGTVTTEVNEEGLVQKVKEFFMGSTDILESCESALQLIKKIPLGEKSVDVLLIESRCYELQGKHKSAMSSAGKLINKASSYGSLPNDSVS